MDQFMRKIGEAGVAAVELEVDIEHERVISMYRRYGFEELPRRRFFKQIGR